MSDDYETILGQEDCLVMNVYIPKHPVFDDNSLNTSLPVMVYIHGGGLTESNNNYNEYGPQYFMEKKVVLVVINYRLGPFGFLSMGTSDVPGNAGFRDQTLVSRSIETILKFESKNYTFNLLILISRFEILQSNSVAKNRTLNGRISVFPVKLSKFRLILKANAL